MKAIRQFLTHPLVWPFTTMVLCAIFPMLPLVLLYRALGASTSTYSTLTVLYVIAWWLWQRRPGDPEPKN